MSNVGRSTSGSSQESIVDPNLCLATQPDRLFIVSRLIWNTFDTRSMHTQDQMLRCTTINRAAMTWKQARKRAFSSHVSCRHSV